MKIHVRMDVSFIENQPYFTKNHLQGRKKEKMMVF
jgi:hypothetical protein